MLTWSIMLGSSAGNEVRNPQDGWMHGCIPAIPFASSGSIRHLASVLSSPPGGNVGQQSEAPIPRVRFRRVRPRNTEKNVPLHNNEADTRFDLTWVRTAYFLYKYILESVCRVVRVAVRKFPSSGKWYHPGIASEPVAEGCRCRRQLNRRSGTRRLWGSSPNWSPLWRLMWLTVS